MKADRERQAAGEALSESEREELARLRRQKAEWARERAELEMEREVLKRSVVLWVKDSMNR
jgi:transposase